VEIGVGVGAARPARESGQEWGQEVAGEREKGWVVEQWDPLPTVRATASG